MGNCVSEYKHGAFNQDFGDDPSAFRVFIKRKNKFIQGWLKIADEEIIFTRGGGHIECWPLGYLRRYGYTRAGIFFFESGRRCKSGEGLHTFQSHQAERIFQIVQLRIKNVEVRNSRASSVASSRFNSVCSNSRIYPVQRFSSEGANNQLFNIHSPEATPPNQAPVVPSRANRPKSFVSNQSLMSRSQIDFIDSWPNEQLPRDADIVNEHVLRAKKPCVDPICRQRKYHSYINVELAEPQHRVLNYSQNNLSSLNGSSGAFSQGAHPAMSASFCGQPSTSAISEEASQSNDFIFGHHNAAFDPMTMSASAALGQNIMDPPRLSYATLAMPETSSIQGSPQNRANSVRSDCSSSSTASSLFKSSPSVNYTRVQLNHSQVAKSSASSPTPADSARRYRAFSRPIRTGTRQ